jgi:hypothetical protein
MFTLFEIGFTWIQFSATDVPIVETLKRFLREEDEVNYAHNLQAVLCTSTPRATPRSMKKELQISKTGWTRCAITG